MDNGTPDVYTDELFVGLTRPAMIAGIPYSAFVVNFMATALIFLAFGNPLYLLIGVPIHSILYLICSADPRFFDGAFSWLKTNAKCRNIAFWGAASFSPSSTKKWQE